MLSKMLKNYCAGLIQAYAVLARLWRSSPANLVAGRCERARQCRANFALALIYSLHTLRFLCAGSFETVRARLKPARNVFQHPVRLLLLLILFVPLAGQATPPLPASVTGAIPDLRPAGEGRLRWLGLHIYDAALWTRSDAVSVQSEFALDIRYARKIPAKRLVNASVKEMRRLGFGDRELHRQWAAEMARVFPDIRKGDRLTGVNLPGVGAQFYHNGRLVGTVADEQFALAFFSIWLDPRTREPGLRESLIGQS